ncbi:MAG TPA: glycosyltransferase family 39 protein [Candidatus Binatia bacterium]
MIFFLALAPRALALGSFLTVDEAYHWFERAPLFLRALQQGDFAATNLIGHPGVTTMWLGALGAAAHRSLADTGWIAYGDPALERAFLRFPVALVTALSVALAYPLLKRLLGDRTALLAALLWTADPFLVAHSRLLHMDALLASFVALALLAALVAFRFDDSGPEIRRRMLVASAMAGGLALLTKSPAVMLAPTIGLLAIWKDRRSPRFVRDAILPALAWAGVAVGIWIALWPAAWVDLPGAFASVVQYTAFKVGSPHESGNFFMGRTVDDPGPLFYPVAIALRLTPWAVVGLLGAALLRRRCSPCERLAVCALAIFAVLFAIAISLPPKKFDRYALPIFPALDIIAAVGLASILDFRLPILDFTQSKIQNLKSKIVWSAVVLLLAANLAWYHPYELAYYNPLLGGGPVAARMIPVGWGEGYEQAGAFIAAQSDGCARPVAAWLDQVLQPYICSSAVPPEWASPGNVNYAVLSIDQIQRNQAPELISRLSGEATPLHTVRIHGIDYAYVYQIAPRVKYPVDVDFGPAIRLSGYDADVSALRSSGILTLTLSWHVRAPLREDFNLFIRVLNSDGERVGEVDAPPGGSRAPTSGWQVGRYVTSIQQVSVPAHLEAGAYWIALRLYNPRDSTRVPMRLRPRSGAPDAGPDALLLSMEVR